jgi:hypothetical protein
MSRRQQLECLDTAQWQLRLFVKEISSNDANSNVHLSERWAYF